MIWYQSLQTSSISCKLEIHSFNNLIRVCTLYYYKMQFACHDQWYIEVMNITIFHNNCNRRINAIKLQKRIKWTTRNLSTCCWSSVDFLLPPEDLETGLSQLWGPRVCKSMALVLGSQFAIPNPWIHSYVSLNNEALFVAHQYTRSFLCHAFDAYVTLWMLQYWRVEYDTRRNI